MFTTYEEVMQFCGEKSIQMIDFKIIDLAGRWRHLSIPVNRFTPDTLVYGIGFDGSNYGFAPVERSDMVFIPDISTAVYDPFTQVATLSMIGDVFVIAQPDNYRFDQDPRTIARKAEEYMRSSGIADEIRLGPEYEFHVFDHMIDFLAISSYGAGTSSSGVVKIRKDIDVELTGRDVII
ncbi:MAG: glutamine synthetase beta-grasp domain-containing protein, partial [Syntrophomonadaceae bacterium]|nr:glutamine synthetase beta-grasp domain-containing protein [Syntrophomonadaceae bacterium]